MTSHQILNPADHGDLRVHTGPGAEWGDAVMACLTVPAEFRQVQAHCPIVFRRDDASGAFSAMALFGFSHGENLFLGIDRWDAGYRPAALAIQPFLVGRHPAGGEAQVHIDMAHPRIASGGEGTRVFDAEGRPTPYLERIASLLGNLDHGYRASGGFFAALESRDLLEPFSFEVSLDDGSRHSLVGFHTIAEERLAALPPAEVAQLHAEGWLEPIYMAMASISQFSRLVALKNASLAHG